MSVETILTRLPILLYEFDYDDTMRWLIDMYTYYMMILFDITWIYGDGYWSQLRDPYGRTQVKVAQWGFYGPPTKAVVVGVQLDKEVE